MEEVSSPSVPPKRPVFLLVLCILSFVYLGFGLFSLAVNYAIGPNSTLEIEKEEAALDNELEKIEAQGENDWRPFVEKYKSFTVILNRKFYYVQAANFLVLVLGITSVVFMIRRRKIGFHLYIIYSLLSVCFYYLFMSPSMVPTMIVMFSASVSALFIFLYSRNLKWMS